MTWIDHLNHPAPDVEEPPRSGKGSSKGAWAKYADELGYEVRPGATRAEIIALVDSGPPPGPNRAALEDQIEAMATGREHRALVEACRQLADQVDRAIARGTFSDKAWREYRLSLRALREAVADGGDGDPINAWINDSRGQIRDTEDAGT